MVCERADGRAFDGLASVSQRFACLLEVPELSGTVPASAVKILLRSLRHHRSTAVTEAAARKRTQDPAGDREVKASDRWEDRFMLKATDSGSRA
jgi:hypothetical protein